MKESIGIILGLILVVAIPVVILGLLSKDEQKARITPAQVWSWKEAEFADEKLNKIFKDLEVSAIDGFLFRKDSQTPMYFPIYAMKSPKGKDAVRAYFKDTKDPNMEYLFREVSALKLLGKDVDKFLIAAKEKGKYVLYICDDFLVISFEVTSTNKILDEMQMIHFLHRYFKKREKSEQPAATPSGTPPPPKPAAAPAPKTPAPAK